MTETKTEISENEPRGCRFPVAPDRLCGRATVPASGDPDGRGRPSSYCDDPAHNRAAAWRARRAFDSERSGQRDAPAVLARPVSTAGAQAGRYVEDARALATQLIENQERVLAALATLGDADAAAVQLETVTAESEKVAAELRERAARAEQLLLDERELREDADAAAGELATELGAEQAAKADLVDQVAAVERDLAAVEQQNEQLDGNLTTLSERMGQVEIERDELQADKTFLADENERQAAAIEALRSKLTAAQQEAAVERQRAEHAENERATLATSLADERGRRERAQADVERATGQAAQLQGLVDEQRAELREATARASAAREELAGMVAQLESAKAALAAEQNHANQRITDQDRLYARQLDELRAEVERLRSGKK